MTSQHNIILLNKWGVKIMWILAWFDFCKEYAVVVVSCYWRSGCICKPKAMYFIGVNAAVSIEGMLRQIQKSKSSPIALLNECVFSPTFIILVKKVLLNAIEKKYGNRTELINLHISDWDEITWRNPSQCMLMLCCLLPLHFLWEFLN